MGARAGASTADGSGSRDAHRGSKSGASDESTVTSQAGLDPNRPADPVAAGRPIHFDIGALLSWRGAAAAAAVLTAALVASEVVWLLARPLALLFLAVVLAQALAPAVALLARRLPRPVAIVLVYLALLAIAIGAAAIVVPVLIGQAQALLPRLPELIDKAERWLGHWDQVAGGRLRDVAAAQFEPVAGRLVALPFTLGPPAFDALLVIFMSLYWLLGAPILRRLALGRFPAEQRARVETVLDEMGGAMGGFVRSVVIDGVIIGALAFAGLVAIGVDYPLVLAVIAGIGEVVPVVGPLVVTVPVVGVALLDSPEQALVALAFWIGLQQVETHIISPNVIRSQTDTPPLLVLFAAVAGGTVGGFLGAVVAIPLAGAIRVLVLRVLLPVGRRRSDDQGREWHA